jgi:hypothetical protein
VSNLDHHASLLRSLLQPLIDTRVDAAERTRFIAGPQLEALRRRDAVTAGRVTRVYAPSPSAKLRAIVRSEPGTHQHSFERTDIRSLLECLVIASNNGTDSEEEKSQEDSEAVRGHRRYKSWPEHEHADAEGDMDMAGRAHLISSVNWNRQGTRAKAREERAKRVGMSPPPG